MSDDVIQFNAVINVEFKDLEGIPDAYKAACPVLRCIIPLTISNLAVTSSKIETMFLQDAPPFTPEILAGLFPRVGELMLEIAKGRQPDSIAEVEPGNLDALFHTHTIQ